MLPPLPAPTLGLPLAGREFPHGPLLPELVRNAAVHIWLIRKDTLVRVWSKYAAER